MTLLFVPLMVGIILTFLSGGANAACCWKGGCGSKPDCNPCEAGDVCGPSGSCASSYCKPHAMEGVLSPESIARKLNQEAVEMRKAEEHLKDREADAHHQAGDQDNLVKRNNVMNLFDMPEEALQERRVGGKVEKKATGEDVPTERNVGDEGKVHNIEA